MIRNQINYMALAVSSALLLSGCGGSGGSDGGGDRFAVERNSAKVSLQPLKSTAANSFATHLKNGLYTSSINQGCVECAVMASDAQATPVPTTEDFSTTNNQEAGVDEADRIKYDGEHLYMIANPYHDPISDMGQQDYIKIFARGEDASLSPVANINLPEDFFTLSGLYLEQDRLVGVGNGHHWGAGIIADIWHPVNQEVNLAIYDVSTQESPQLDMHIQFEGHLISSRRVEDTMYFVSSFSPSLSNITHGASTDAEKEQNFNTISNTDINTLMPKITLNGGSEQNLVSPENCFIPEDATNVDGYDSIVTLTAMDIDDPSNFRSVCVNALTHHIYASTGSIYLMGTNNSHEGVIHRFALDDNLTYVGAGNVDGHFGWQNASFRLSEHQDHLRVVTTKSTNDGPFHQLFVLNTVAQDSKLPIVAQLPNEQQPELIGKPNEDIFAVRYFNDKAYVVTFERIDPLYVIDISEPTAPFIAGELEIPGFSSYLHPINENLLLGVGQEVNTDALPGNGGANGADILPVTVGAKVALFDVSNPAEPTQLHELVYYDSFTPVQWDHHALTYLPIDDNHFRFALPITHWYTNGDNWWGIENKLNLLEVNIDDNGAQLLEKSALSAPEPTDEHYYIDSSSDRSVIHGNDVYYIHGNQVIESEWPE